MKNDIPFFIDSHVHLDMIQKNHPDRISWMKTHGCIPISWAWADGVETEKDIVSYLEAKARFIRDLAKEGVPCYYLVGVHPRSITADLTPEAVKNLVLPYLDDPLCLGLGEIGMETRHARDEEIFEAHLSLWPEIHSRGKRIGVHTPRKDKAGVTEVILSVLDRFPGIESDTVIDHCMPHTVKRILDKGFTAGITLSPVKASFDDLKTIVDRHQGHLNRIMCNTDSGTIVYDDLYRLTTELDLSKDVRKCLAFDTAAAFFGVEAPEG